jgi:hypothetical protein
MIKGGILNIELLSFVESSDNTSLAVGHGEGMQQNLWSRIGLFLGLVTQSLLKLFMVKYSQNLWTLA